MKNLDKWKAFLKEQLDYTPDDLINKCPNGLCPELLQDLIVKYNHHPRRNPYMEERWEAAVYRNLRRGEEGPNLAQKMASEKRTGRPKFIVLHVSDTSSTGSTAREFLRKNKKRTKSSHYEVSTDGVILEYLDPSVVAYHAGRVNADSIGIDMTGKNVTSWPYAQIQGVKKLISYLSERYQIPQIVAPWGVKADVFKEKGLDKLSRYATDEEWKKIRTPFICKLEGIEGCKESDFRKNNPEEYSELLRSVKERRLNARSKFSLTSNDIISRGIGIIGHHDVASDSRPCPGKNFPFYELGKLYKLEKLDFEEPDEIVVEPEDEMLADPDIPSEPGL